MPSEAAADRVALVIAVVAAVIVFVAGGPNPGVQAPVAFAAILSGSRLYRHLAGGSS